MSIAGLSVGRCGSAVHALLMPKDRERIEGPFSNLHKGRRGWISKFVEGKGARGG